MLSCASELTNSTLRETLPIDRREARGTRAGGRVLLMDCGGVLIRHSHGDESADRFVPLLIYVVLRANLEHLVSNVQYVYPEVQESK